jgi:FAD/FMN-containing dehydrogenase
MMIDPGIATNGSRLFTPFFDEIDMIGSFDADTTLGEVNRIAGEHGLCFPLVLSSDASIAAHMAAAEFAPASARFGAYVDNLPGMNWELPTGQRMRLGERVVKSTTGYDLFRFLLHSDGNYGRATEYVLRLRPASAETLTGTVGGDHDALLAVVRSVSRSSWSHWIDRIEWVTNGGASHLEISAGVLPGESRTFEKYLAAIAKTSGSSWNSTECPPLPGLPSWTIKCLPSGAASLAIECATATGGVARALPSAGVVMVYPVPAAAPGFIDALRHRVEQVGGHLFGQHIPLRNSSDEEARWTTQLEDEWKKL